jgi:hypothetical protein
MARDPWAEEAEIAALPIVPWTTDDELVALWHGKSANTIRAYGEDIAAFRAFTGKRECCCPGAPDNTWGGL